MPSARIFCDFWKKITDCWVCGPKIPSGMILRRSWSCFTSWPVELSFSVFIEKIFYIFWNECNSSLLAFVFCGCWKRDEIEHLSESGTDSFSVEVFNFFCDKICCGVGDYFLMHQEIISLQKNFSDGVAFVSVEFDVLFNSYVV